MNKSFLNLLNLYKHFLARSLCSLSYTPISYFPARSRRASTLFYLTLLMGGDGVRFAPPPPPLLKKNFLRLYNCHVRDMFTNLLSYTKTKIQIIHVIWSWYFWISPATELKWIFTILSWQVIHSFYLFTVITSIKGCFSVSPCNKNSLIQS